MLANRRVLVAFLTFAPGHLHAFALSGVTPPPAEVFCMKSCDSGHDQQCDDSSGTLGCDRHPTSSCDDATDCPLPPSPPARPSDAPLLPPTPPPPNTTPFAVSAFLFSLAIFLAFLTVVSCLYASRGPGSWRAACLRRWCWPCLCCIPRASYAVVVSPPPPVPVPVPPPLLALTLADDDLGKCPALDPPPGDRAEPPCTREESS